MSRSVNSTFVTFDGTSVFNKTVLDEFQYKIYSNGTLSNDTSCVLVFGKYVPAMLPNGTIVNGTRCDIPIEPMKVRGGLGIASSVLFAIALCLAGRCLGKHGASYLEEDRSAQFHRMSRRWQWTWVLLASVLGFVSGIMAIDVDRDYIPGTAIILQNVFYYCLLPILLAATWEMTRHWAHFQERLITDNDAHFFPPEDTRSKIEFYMPMIFYVFAFMAFFLSILRRWTPISRQFPSAATDGRFKAGSIMALFALLVIFVSSLISQHYYRQRIPLKISLCLTFLLIKVVYNIISAWTFNLSPLRLGVNNGYIYGLGYIPALLVVFTIVASGFAEDNEDLVIIKERRRRAALPDIPERVVVEMDSMPMGRGGTFTTMNTEEDILQKPPPPYSAIA